MNRHMISALVKIDLVRMLPFLGVTLLIGCLGTGIIFIPSHEFEDMGFLLLRHLPIIFALILGADLVARDKEQKTQTTLAALPLSPVITFCIRSALRLTLVFGLWLSIYIFMNGVLDVVLAEKMGRLIAWFAKKNQGDAFHTNLGVLFAFSYFTAALCSLFASDTLTAIGAGTALAIGGTTLNSIMQSGNHLTLGLILVTVVIAATCLKIVSNGRTKTLSNQFGELSAMVIIILIVLYIL